VNSGSTPSLAVPCTTLYDDVLDRASGPVEQLRPLPTTPALPERAMAADSTSAKPEAVNLMLPAALAARRLTDAPVRRPPDDETAEPPTRKNEDWVTSIAPIVTTGELACNVRCITWHLCGVNYTLTGRAIRHMPSDLLGQRGSVVPRIEPLWLAAVRVDVHASHPQVARGGV